MAREKKAKTKTEKIIRGLIALGFEEVTSKNKYRIFEAPHKSKDGSPMFYFVGKSAALRVNNRTAVAGSFSLGDSEKDRIIKAGGN